MSRTGSTGSTGTGSTGTDGGSATGQGGAPPDEQRSAAAPAAGRAIVQADIAGTAVFAVTATLEVVLFRPWTQVIGVAVALTLFTAGCVAFLAGYARAIQRSRTDELAVTSVFLLMGPAVPTPVRWRLGLCLAAQVVVALTTAGLRTFTPLAFGVLVPMFGLGLNGLWAARHGRFPPRRPSPRRPVAEPVAPTDAEAGDEGPHPDRGGHHSEGGMEQNAGHG